MGPTNIISILLIIATLVSYIPQYKRLLNLRSSAGISVTSTLLNTLVAQVQAATMYYLFRAAPFIMRYGVPIDTPPSTRDWLNLTQILVQWICSLLLLAMVVVLPNHSSTFSNRDISKKAAVSILVAHVVLFIISIIAGGRPNDVVYNIVRNINSGVVNPLFTLLAIVAFFFQANTTWPAADPGALSKLTLGLQSVTFLLLAISWPFRLILPPNMWKLGSKPAVLMEWYPWVGWSCVNNAVMAIGQGLLLLGIGRVVNGRVLLAGESQSLLGSSS